MSTNSTINILNSDGSISGIYCQFDGYLDGVGRILKTYYTTKELVEELITNGYLESIGATIDKCKRVDDLIKYYKLAFHQIPSREYNYLFIDGNWLVSNIGKTNDRFISF